MTPEQLKASILQRAMEGKMVEQDTDDEPVSELLKRIKSEKEKLVLEGKIKKDKKEFYIFKDIDGNYYEKINNKVVQEIEVPFEIPESWEWVRLDNITTYIQRGKSPKYSERKKFPEISQKCVQWTVFSVEKSRFIVEESVDSYAEKRILQNLDLLWNSTGLGTIGRVSLYEEENNPFGWAVVDSHVTVVRPFNGLISNRYIYYFISLPMVQLSIEEKSSGSTKQKELSTKTIKNYLVPLPPLEEQKRIVDQIQILLEKIDGYAESIIVSKKS